MRSIGIAAAMLVALLAVTGCKHRKVEPIPGPRASQPAAEAARPPSIRPLDGTPVPGGPSTPGAVRPDTTAPSGERRHGASGISWFQGGFEEAFSCPKCTAMFWREALDHYEPAWGRPQ